MRRPPVEWLGTPDDDEEYPPGGYEMTFELLDDWVATDGDQLVARVEVTSKSTITTSEPYEAILKQYGGESLLNDMLLSEQDVEPGSTWLLLRDPRGLHVHPHTDD